MICCNEFDCSLFAPCHYRRRHRVDVCNALPLLRQCGYKSAVASLGIGTGISTDHGQQFAVLLQVSARPHAPLQAKSALHLLHQSTQLPEPQLPTHERGKQPASMLPSKAGCGPSKSNAPETTPSVRYRQRPQLLEMASTTPDASARMMVGKRGKWLEPDSI